MTSSYEYHNSSNHSTLNQHRLLFFDSITHSSALSIEIRALWTLGIVASSVEYCCFICLVLLLVASKNWLAERYCQVIFSS